MSTYNKIWYQKNKASVSAKQKIYQIANQDKIKAQRRETYQKNRAKILVEIAGCPKRAAYMKIYRKDHKTQMAIDLREWKKKNKEKANRYSRDTYLRKKYGINIVEYQKRLDACGNICEVCKKAAAGKHSRSRLQLDHCHDTGVIRGFICGHCNTALGMVGDSVEILHSLILYLKKSRVAQ